MLRVKVQRVLPNAVLPVYAHGSDACFDLTAAAVETTTDFVYIDTGLAFAIPDGYVGLVFARSSVTKTALTLANSVGVIDASYRGTVQLRFRFANQSHFPIYNVGDRCGQMLIIPRPVVEFDVVDVLDTTARGDGGFGSTGQ